MKGPPDKILVKRTLEGDSSAFGTIVGRYQKTVYNVALRILHNREDAEDAAQTIFVKVYKNLHLYDSNYRFFSWLYRTAINESLNAARGRRRHDPLPTDIAAPSQLSRTDTEQLISTALYELDPEDRALVILKHLEGLAYRELAFIFDIKEKTVKSRLYTARQRLRNILQSYDAITH